MREEREDDIKLCPICGKFLDGDKEWNDYARSFIPAKREDLEWLILMVTYPPEDEKKFKRIKEVYGIK